MPRLGVAGHLSYSRMGKFCLSPFPNGPKSKISFSLHFPINAERQAGICLQILKVLVLLD